MQSSSETQRNLLQEDIQRTKKVVSALEQEKLLTGMLLKKSKDELSYAQNFLDGHYKFTFLIQGDPQVGKTTFLNVLLDDAMIPSSGHNAIIIVQYDETRPKPALFTAHLDAIFDSERQIFVIKPENLKDTELRGSADIRTVLKQASKILNPLSESTNINSMRSGKTVFVIKYKIPWLKELLPDEFVLNRIQFVDIDIAPENENNRQDFLRLEKIISSADHGNIFVADATKLFTINTAEKYYELRKNKEKSLLIINRTDLLGPKAHLQKIKQEKNQSRLCSRLGVKSIQSIENIIQEHDETEEMRREIYLQSFYDDQGIDQDSLTDGDVIYFVSALFEFNKILLSKYEKCEYDGEKADLCSLFDERNNNNLVYQSNRKKATRKNLDILQYYLKEEEETYQDNSKPAKMAVSNITRKRFGKLSNDLVERVKEVRLKILDYQSYLTEALSEEEINELKTLRKTVKNLFDEKSKGIAELIVNFKTRIVELLVNFLKAVQAINADFYVVRANHMRELSNLTKNLEDKAMETEDRFEKDYEKIDKIYRDEIEDLDKTKKHTNYYITNSVELEYEKLKREDQTLVKVIQGLSNWARNTIITFINDGKEGSVVKNMLRLFAKYFLKSTSTKGFESRVNNSKSTFEETMAILASEHYEVEQIMKDEFEVHFIDYLGSGKGGSLEKAKKIIEECSKDEK